MDAVAFQRIAASVKALAPSKWFQESRYTAARLGISTETLYSFLERVDGGGALIDDEWDSNPAPYDVRIDLDKLGENNILGLHCVESKVNKAVSHVDFAQPSPSVVKHDATYCRFGPVGERSKKLTPKEQRAIVSWVVVGDHKSLQTVSMRGVRDDRRQHWAAWAEDARSIYHTRHLPFIVCAYRSVWDIDIDPKMTPMDVR